jgi:hypothetical protein
MPNQQQYLARLSARGHRKTLSDASGQIAALPPWDAADLIIACAPPRREFSAKGFALPSLGKL